MRRFSNAKSTIKVSTALRRVAYNKSWREHGESGKETKGQNVYARIIYKTIIHELATSLILSSNKLEYLSEAQSKVSLPGRDENDELRETRDRESEKGK